MLPTWPNTAGNVEICVDSVSEENVDQLWDVCSATFGLPRSSPGSSGGHAGARVGGLILCGIIGLCDAAAVARVASS